MRYPLLLIGLAAAGLLAADRPTPASAQAATVSDTSLLARMREHIAFVTRDGGAWWTSNAAYAAEDQGQDAYWLHHDAPSGAVAATACLWGERADSVVAVYWRFFSGPDPLTGKVIAYQSSRAGQIGIGSLQVGVDGTVEVEQTFVRPDGQQFRVRHVERRIGRDSIDSRSFQWQDGAWQPQRTYVWVRRRRPEPPC